MKITVNVSKSLQKFIPIPTVTLEIVDYRDIFNFFKAQYPEFKKFVSKNKSTDTTYQDVCLIHNRKVIDANQLDMPVRSKNNVFLGPIIFGAAPTYGTSSSNYYNELKSSFLYPLFGLSTAGYEAMDLEGLNRRVVDSSLFGRAESIYDVPFREGNDIFKGLKITNTANLPVPLVYGQSRVAGNNINTYVKSYRTNPDFFKVSDLLAASSRIEVADSTLFFVEPDYVESDYVELQP